MRWMAVAALAAFSLTACGGSDTPEAARNLSPTPSASTTSAANTVELVGRTFSPNILHVTRGAAVTWVNRSTPTSCRNLSGTGTEDCSHNVASVDRLFDSHPKCRGIGTPCMATGETFTYTFSTPGTYLYYCYIHAPCTDGTCGGMSGRVIVT